MQRCDAATYSIKVLMPKMQQSGRPSTVSAHLGQKNWDTRDIQGIHWVL